MMNKHVSRIGLIIIGLLLALLAFGQNCSSCPPGSNVTLSSSYSPSATHQWTCTNGFSSTSVNPTFTPSADVTCTLVVTDASGCTSSSQSSVDVCECSCSNACISIDYNNQTDVVTFADVGTTCSGFVSQTRQYKTRAAASWTTIPGGNTISGCDIKESLDATPTVTVSGSNFNLNITGLNNYCSCIGDLEIDYVFSVLSSSATYFPACGSTSQTHSITAADFATAGNVCNVYVKNLTSWGYVINQYRFTYNGAGLNVNNVTVSTIVERVIYKPIYTRRVVTYSQCPQTTCENFLQIPQQPEGCSNAISFITRTNCVPCADYCLFSNSYNGTTLVSSRQWYYNGSAISPGGTSASLCMNARPNGEYCVNTVFSDGCTASACHIIQPACNLAVNITASGTVLTANLTGCVGTPTYSWSRWNGSSWVSVGTNSSTYNTSGTEGDYRCSVSCSGPPACTNIGNYTYVPPCTASVSITTGATTLTANVSNCGGSTINYTWQRWTGTAWSTVQTASTTSTSNVYTPTLSGSYRVHISCNGCEDTAETTWTAPNPCTGFSITMTGNNGPLCNGTLYTYGRNITGGTSPFTQQWTLNGSNVGTGTTYNFTPSSSGTYLIQIVVTDNNGCTAAAQKVVSSQTCCGVSVGLSPTNQTVCTNQSVTYTATPTGGSGPYTYSWTSTSPPQSWGSSSTSSISFATAGARTIQIQVTDANGCSATNSTTMTVNNCADCTCTPTLTLNAGTCQLTLGTTGSGCANFDYQLQYSATGTGWTAILSGDASNGWSQNYTPTANGLYRLLIFATGCTLQETATVSVGCVINCTCTPGTLTLTDCELSWTNPCSGWVATLQHQSGSFSDVTQVNPYIPGLAGNYRVKYSKSGCSNVFSNTINVVSPACNAQGPDNISPYGDVYCVDYAFPFQDRLTVAGNNTVRVSPYVCSPDPVADGDYNASYNFDWGDGSTPSGNLPATLTRTYASNGTFISDIVIDSHLGNIEGNMVHTPSGTNPVPSIWIQPECNVTGPVVHAKSACQAKLWFNFELRASNTTLSVTSSTFQIDGVTYSLPYTVESSTLVRFATPLSYPIIESQTVLSGTLPVTLEVTVNGQNLYLYGFISICTKDPCFTP